ncbi:MAG: choice-of-anchor R domain-containing protein [Pirellulales bacterium]
MRSTLIALLILALVAAGNRPTACAGVIADTLPGYNPTFGAIVGNIGDGNQYAEAAELTVGPGTSYTLDSIILALGDATPPSVATVTLFANGAGLPSGPSLETLTAPVASQIPVTDTTTFNSVSHPLLSAGSSYWIVLETGTSNVISWQDAAASTPGTSLTSTDNGITWSSDPTFSAAYEVDGTATVNVVAEPSMFVLFSLASGSVGVVLVRRKRIAVPS